MFTIFVHVALRMMAGAAFTVASAVVVAGAVFGAPQRAYATPKPGPQPPAQQFKVASDITAGPTPTRDTYTVILPPKPTPTPIPVTSTTADGGSVADSSSPSYTTPVGTAQAYAASQVSADNFSCLVNLWNRESGWNTHAENPDSGAYGIPQSLPGSKMAAVGSDWADNYRTQIDWGLSYIASAYGSACAAWSHSNAYGWY